MPHGTSTIYDDYDPRWPATGRRDTTCHEYRLLVTRGHKEVEVTINEDLYYLKALRDVTPIKRAPRIQVRVVSDWEDLAE